jgi:Domain of unknown function (DUF4410)
MKKRLITITVFIVVAFIIGFAYPARAVEKSTQITICILFDNGVNETFEARQAKAQTQLSDWMDDDLVKVFARYTKAGYQAKLIEKREDFTPQSNNYLLTVKIIKYQAGSKAARTFVGYGAGGVSLKINYELFANGANAILTNDGGIFSGREWVKAARKLNENMAKAVTEKLGSK